MNEIQIKCDALIQQFDERRQMFERMNEIVGEVLRHGLAEHSVPLTSLSTRVKASDSLRGKIVKKAGKYSNLHEITDLLGCRIITLYSDDVDKVAALVQQYFTVDWANSVDKRKAHGVNDFGYLSLHYICSLPQSLCASEPWPDMHEWRFEIQMRSTIQHMWAEVEHDIRYKTSVGIPRQYSRSFGRLAGLLELVDDEFCRIRQHMADYRRRMTELMSYGQLADIELNEESWARYLRTEPLRELNERVAAINQGEIFDVPLEGYVDILLSLGLRTLADVDRMIADNGDRALHIIRYKMSSTDLDIVSSATSLQMLCIVEVLTGQPDRLRLAKLLHDMYGKAGYNEALVDDFMALGEKLKDASL